MSKYALQSGTPPGIAITWDNKSNDWIKESGVCCDGSDKKAAQLWCFEHGFQLEAEEWTENCAVLSALCLSQKKKYYLGSAFSWYKKTLQRLILLYSFDPFHLDRVGGPL